MKYKHHILVILGFALGIVLGCIGGYRISAVAPSRGAATAIAKVLNGEKRAQDYLVDELVKGRITPLEYYRDLAFFQNAADLSDCPSKFQKAFTRNMSAVQKAYRIALKYEKELTLDRLKHAVASGADASHGMAEEVRHAEADIRETNRACQRIAGEYGVYKDEKRLIWEVKVQPADAI